MENIITAEKIAKFRAYFSNSQRVAILSHTNPDGDAIGSSLALQRALRTLDAGKDVRVVVPNDMPMTLRFLDPGRDVEVFMSSTKEYTAFLSAADLIIMVDFNDPKRLDAMSEALDRNICATRILIDHHLSPPSYDLEFHTTQSSSTAFIVYSLLKAMGVEIEVGIAEALYTGMSTDTGGFTFGNLTAELYEAVAHLVRCGLNPVRVNQQIYDNQSENRLKMAGYLISEKMVVVAEHHAAYITLTMAEKERFEHQIGDTEGVVNMPMSISGIEFSALLIENRDHIKLSLRSTPESGIDVNALCRARFNGGGHKNASGGKLYCSMQEAELLLSEAIRTF